MKMRISHHWVYFKINSSWSALNNENKISLRKDADLNRQKLMHKMNKLMYLSLSHTKTAGGFAVSSRPVGIDIEPRTRKLSARAIRRLGTEEELRQSPSSISLWIMKEAAWKSLKGPHQPKTITKIKIQNVRKNKSKSRFLFSFKATTINGLILSGHGGLIFRGRLILGIAVI
jgi:4'-phosphopantetheinyl transferase EntD